MFQFQLNLNKSIHLVAGSPPGSMHVEKIFFVTPSSMNIKIKVHGD